MDFVEKYRSGMFDGQAGLSWLAHGWRALRLYGRRAKTAIETGDNTTKTEMLGRANELLNMMSGIIDTNNDDRLGGALMTIYSALRFCLLRANAENSITPLDDYERALSQLDRDLTPAKSKAIT